MAWRISDGNVGMTCNDWDSLVAEAESWYDYLDNRDGSGAMMKNGQVPDEDWALPGFPHSDLIPAESVEEFQRLIDSWQNDIAESLGYAQWVGHGSYAVDAASEAGLRLKVELVPEATQSCLLCVDGYGGDEGKVHCRTVDIPCGPGEMSRFRRAPKTTTYSYREYPGAREWTETVHCKDCQCEECVDEEPAAEEPRSRLTLEQREHELEMTPAPAPRKCPACNGRGYISVTDDDGEGATETCPLCEGTKCEPEVE